MHSATYSPEDNKLRLYPGGRLPEDEYKRMRANGFIWAPKQELFVAPMWTPEREDLLIEFAGTIEDEDKNLVERAEERADRFEDYSDKRAADAQAAKAAVSAIADGIPLGQPIIVGHHSERHARRDAEKIQAGMARAVKAWETSQYWTERAAGAIRAAKYKERPDVRARRIKKLEAEQRKVQRNHDAAELRLKGWEAVPDDNLELARRIAGYSEAGRLPCAPNPNQSFAWSAYDVLQPEEKRYKDCPGWTVAQVKERARGFYPSQMEYWKRWIQHYANRLEYERAMLASEGGIPSDRKVLEKGGAVTDGGLWTVRHGWSYIQRVNKVSVSVLFRWSGEGRLFTQIVPLDTIRGIMTAAEVQAARDAGRLIEMDDHRGFALLDNRPAAPRPAPVKPAEAPEFEAMKQTLESGIKVVNAPQLFPTPPDVARRLVELAQVEPGDRVLEPSAGTGNLIAALLEHAATFPADAKPLELVCVEFCRALAEDLRRRQPALDIRCSDFLECNGDIGRFKRIVMNPPFERGSDIEHINHALNFLLEGGRLVAICANGPRQQELLMPGAIIWQALPEGTFAGTNVRTAIAVFAK